MRMPRPSAANRGLSGAVGGVARTSRTRSTLIGTIRSPRRKSGRSVGRELEDASGGRRHGLWHARGQAAPISTAQPAGGTRLFSQGTNLIEIQLVALRQGEGRGVRPAIRQPQQGQRFLKNSQQHRPVGVRVAGDRRQQTTSNPAIQLIGRQQRSQGLGVCERMFSDGLTYERVRTDGQGAQRLLVDPRILDQVQVIARRTRAWQQLVDIDHRNIVAAAIGARDEISARGLPSNRTPSASSADPPLQSQCPHRGYVLPTLTQVGLKTAAEMLCSEKVRPGTVVPAAATRLG
jgi:hypothetical protein